MPFDTHEILFSRLRDITIGVKAALDSDDPEALPGLIRKHKDVMAALEEAGFSEDPGLLGQVTEIRDRVEEAVAGIQAKQDEIGQRLKATGTKRKLDKAYGV